MNVRVALGLRSLTNADVLVDASHYVANMAGNALFNAADIVAQVTSTTTAVTNLRNAMNALTSDTKLDNIRVCRDALDRNLNILAGKVEAVANNPALPDDQPAAVTFDDYVKYIVRVAQEQEGPVILVGHSMSGVVIAQAGEVLGKEKVSSLIFLDAFMPKNGESVMDLANKVGKITEGKPMRPSVMESLIFSDDQKTSTLKPENIRDLFYHDCKPEDVEFAKQHVGLQPMICLVTKVTVTDSRYGAIPKFYILCTEAHDLDKSILATNVPCNKVFKLRSSHSPFFSMPNELVRIIEQL